MYNGAEAHRKAFNMATLVTDPVLEKQIRAQRTACGADRLDEVWEGVYRMAPMPNDEHQDLVTNWTGVLWEVISKPRLGQVRAGVNVSDRSDDWGANYRVPDVAVFLTDGKALNRGAYWLGGPDLVIEIVSPEDQTRDKIDFYARIGVQELLIIDRNPWCVERFCLQGNHLVSEGCIAPDDGMQIDLRTVPLRVRLVTNIPRPRIEVQSRDGHMTWMV